MTPALPIAARRRVRSEDSRATPKYELSAIRRGPGDTLFEIWQLPAASTPELKHSRYVAGLGGRNLGLYEPRLLKVLRSLDIDAVGLRGREERRFDLAEEHALRIGLTMRALAPMRSRLNMRAVADGIDAMTKEEAAYWLGMAMHRKYPRRVLMALRFLLIDPRGR
jgi:hypothetical protein